MIFHNALRRSVQIPRSRVVAQPLPKSQYLLFLRVRERGERREALNEPMKVGHNRGYLSLLEHRLADQHVVRRRGAPARGSPWERAAIAVVPTPPSDRKNARTPTP